jgi:predicted TIM-barrel fold metal-dependent hydrolase
MNILSDALNDLIKEILFGIKLSQYSDIEDPEDKEETIKKYVERIKNELNVEKYLK